MSTSQACFIQQVLCFDGTTTASSLDADDEGGEPAGVSPLMPQRTVEESANGYFIEGREKSQWILDISTICRKSESTNPVKNCQAVQNIHHRVDKAKTFEVHASCLGGVKV